VSICHEHLAREAIYLKIGSEVCAHTSRHELLIIGWRPTGILERDANRTR
jgi:hypothetical protein